MDETLTTGELKSTTSQQTPDGITNESIINNNKFDKQEKQHHNEFVVQSYHKEAIATTGKGTGVNVGASGKNASERKTSVNFDEKVKVESDLEITELLGSVTTQNCPGTRTSARVIQKMKADQTRPTTPPPTEREQKKEEKSIQKTPSQLRANKPTWTNLERNHFFDALNEFGKDFDAIGNYINAKLKRRCATDVAFKSKDQVRQHYYQTYHKICKYIKFSEEIKKPAQELYALINYGEMRRKLQFVTDKHFMKLKNLVYQGYITVRCKGKNIRVKTPSCKALRRLNQLDDSLEDIRLPSKIEVLVSPANMESFGRVQTIAQNPRVRTTVPLHKKLVNFIKTFQFKWRSAEMKLAEESLKLFPHAEQNGPNAELLPERSVLPVTCQDTEMRFQPKSGVIIHRPLLSITEYLSSMNICLTAYEERMGVKVRGETLSFERNANTKRQRTESGSEKRSPETKKPKQSSSPAYEKNDSTGVTIDTMLQETELFLHKCESSGDELSDEINELLSDVDLLKKEEGTEMSKNDTAMNTHYLASTSFSSSSCSSNSSSIAMSTMPPSATNNVRNKRSSGVSGNAVGGGGGGGTNAKSTRSALAFKPLISDDALRRIRKGWTVSNAADITIGDLYVVFGHDSKLELEYYWTDVNTNTATVTAAASITTITTATTAAVTTTTCDVNAPETTSAIFMQKQTGMPYNPNECDDPNLLKTLSISKVGNKLKHLLLIANLSERIRKRQCSCGHTCERNTAKTRIERDLATFVSSKTFATNGNTDNNNALFRQPIVPKRRPIHSMDPVMQLSALQRQKLSRQVLVQRLLLPGANHAYDVLDVKNLQNNLADATTLAQAATDDHMPNAKTIETNKCFNVIKTAAAMHSTDAHNVNNTEDASNLPKFDNNVQTPAPNYTFDIDADAGATISFSNNFYNNVDQFTSAQAQNEVINAITAPITVSSTTSSEAAPSSSSLLNDSVFDDYSNTSNFNGMSPMHYLRDSTSNSRWLEENLNDFSLNSLLGHLDEITGSRDILDPSSNLSVISESSVDFMHKFQEITALMQSQDKD